MFSSPLFFALGLGGLLAAFAAAPVLIHLINMMRHRRVKWAAMEFLLQSHKKHRNWIRLKQMLLLAARMAVMVMLALMLSTLVHYLLRGLGLFQAQFGHDTPTHHYVLLDDSFSMSDRVGADSVYSRAKIVVQRIADRAAQRQNQRFTLIRYSQADERETDFEQIADLNAIRIGAGFEVLLEEKQSAFDASELDVGPSSSLRVVKQLIGDNRDEKALVYLISDFRDKDWNNPTEAALALRDLKNAKADVQFINCVRSEQSNLAIVAVTPSAETRAAGVPLFVNISVKNFGDKEVKKVQVRVKTRFFDSQLATSEKPEQCVGQEDELPVIQIDDIQAGATVVRQVQVYFTKPGRHVVEASLSSHVSDSITADSRRFCVIDFPASEPVLVIDGSREGMNAYYLESVFQPGERTNTGIRPVVKTVAFLRDETQETLNEFHAIYLFDISRLDDRAIRNLEAYVRQGGGLCFFAGDYVEASVSFYNNKLYRNGEGLFPVELDPLQTDTILVSDPDEDAPDIQVENHPIFDTFLGERNSLIRLVNIDRYLQIKKGWKPAPNSSTEVAARIRTGQPLVVDRKFGKGHVVAVLTTLAPEWNNWGNDPSIVVVVLKLQSYLASGRRSDLPVVVGNPIELKLLASKHVKDVSFVVPGVNSESRDPIHRVAVKQVSNDQEKDQAEMMVTSLSGSETRRSGIYDGMYFTTDSKAKVMRWAVNVEPNEGKLTLVDPGELISKLASVNPQFLYWDEYEPVLVEQAGFKWSKYLLYALIFLLLLEQIVAYLVSYHPARRGVN